MSRGLIGSISTVTFCSAASWQAKRRLRLYVRMRRARSSPSAPSGSTPAITCTRGQRSVCA